jgi:hypothetical protein
VTKVYKHDTVGIDGFEYRLPPGLLDEAFVEDLMKMEREEFVRKYSLVPRDGRTESSRTSTAAAAALSRGWSCMSKPQSQYEPTLTVHTDSLESGLVLPLTNMRLGHV